MNETGVKDAGATGFERFQRRGGWWVVAQFVLMIGIGLAGWAPPRMPVDPWVTGAAWTLFLAGAWIGIWGTWTLGHNRTAYPEPKDGGQLIQHGAYAWVRHPLYICLLLLGLSWSLGRWNPAAGVGTLLLGLLLDWKARQEEVRLRRVYPAYADYERRVKRFIPGIY